jgi:branched-chain amino acid transport system ATP-binding protein
VLEIKDVVAAHGELVALHGVSLSVGRGEIVALLGANGGGKTTLLKTIMGVVRPRAGSIVWNGEDLANARPDQVVERGLALVPEGRRLFTRMTVLENLELGAFAPRARAKRNESLERVYEIFPVLRERRSALVNALSGGQQQMVALGRALMTNPTLLMLDEPSLGIAPRIVESIFAALADINRSGVGVFIVEQNVHAALVLAHRAYLLESGRIVGEGDAARLLADEHVQRAYLGPLRAR